MFKNLDLAGIRREVIAESKSRTSAFATKHYTEVKAEAKAKRSDKVQALEQLLATGTFGCQSKAVAQALTVLTGEEIHYESASSRSSEPRIDPFPIGVAVVALKTDRWSNPFGADTVVINGTSTSASRFTDATGTSHQISGRKVNSRPATAKEIETLVNALSDRAVLGIAISMLDSANQK